MDFYHGKFNKMISKNFFLPIQCVIIFSLTIWNLNANNTIKNSFPTPPKVIKVTTLNPSGPGSFKAAVDSKGPRIVVFEVGGIIDLNRETLIISEPNLHIAGQTAPSPGITFIRGGIKIITHHVTIQHISVRPGDVGDPRKSGWEVDGIAATGGQAHDIWIDHCSVSWSTDENISVSGPRTQGPENTAHDVVISNCIIAECLSNSTHAKGEHSKGSLIHDNCRNVVIKQNLYAHNMARNPYYKTGASGLVQNNLVYNPGKRAINSYWVQSEWKGFPEPPKAELSILGNVLLPGQDTRLRGFIHVNHAKLYTENNIILESSNQQFPEVAGEYEVLEHPSKLSLEHKAMPTEKVVDYVLENAGARPADRDPIDHRIIRTVYGGRGKIIDSQEEVGGYPNYESTYRALEIPAENIEEWIQSFTQAVEN